MPEDRSFLGRGWAFPPTFNKKSNEILLVEARQDIEQSLAILFSTSLGERVLQPEYGCNLNDFQYEPINTTLIGLIKDMIENAILYHEPRINLEELEITKANSADTVEGKLQIFLEYSIRGANSRFNFVYDFYLREGIAP